MGFSRQEYWSELHFFLQDDSIRESICSKHKKMIYVEIHKGDPITGLKLQIIKNCLYQFLLIYISTNILPKFYCIQLNLAKITHEHPFLSPNYYFTLTFIRENNSCYSTSRQDLEGTIPFI